MRDELNRNQVKDAQTTHDNLCDAAYHEASNNPVLFVILSGAGRVDVAEIFLSVSTPSHPKIQT